MTDPCLQPNISFSQHLDQSSLQTLSTHNAASGGSISGFLYVPDLKRDDPCVNISEPYVPHNVTRQANLPPTDFTLVAIAPWINVECSLAYLGAARSDPARAFLFYLVGNGASTGSAQPPPISSPVWSLDDGGAWKRKNPFPVYAIPSDVGDQLMQELSLYSGNLTDVPYGHVISELPSIDPRDYVRMYTRLSVKTGPSLPGIWVFLLIIVGIIVVMLAITSVTMHLIQRSRRNALRRRVISGEVNLEALGIKRLTVPQDIINKFPLFTYNCEDEKLPAPSSGSKKDNHTVEIEQDDSSEGSSSAKEILEHQNLPQTHELSSSVIEDTTSNDSFLVHKFLPYSQPTCPICLDDFESGITPIRELPCGHIFHPECIDAFLYNNSSLCPMCKTSVLPKGSCPTKITNSMVRRERNLRRLRSRVTVSEEGHVANPRGRIRNFGSDIRRMIFHPSTAGEIQPSPPMPLQPRRALMTSAIGARLPPSQDRLGRQQIARQRIRELAGQSFVEDSDVSDERRQSKCTVLSIHFKLTANDSNRAERIENTISRFYISFVRDEERLG